MAIAYRLSLDTGSLSEVDFMQLQDLAALNGATRYGSQLVVAVKGSAETGVSLSLSAACMRNET